MGIINTPAAVLKSWILQVHQANYGKELRQLDLLWGVTTSVFCIGGCIGGVSAGPVIDKIGARKALIYNNTIVILGVSCEVLAMFVPYYELLIVGRFIVGLNAGLGSGVCPIYICDLAPKNRRGAMGLMYQVWMTVGLLLASTLGTRHVLGRETTWHYMLALPAILGVIQLVVLLLYCPESPRHLLIIKGDEAAAVKVLHWLRGAVDIQEEIVVMKSEHAQIKSLPKLTPRSFQHEPLLRKPLIVVTIVMAAQQMSGIVAIALFSSKIYVDVAGLTHEAMQWANIGYTFVSASASALTMTVLVEKVGRKRLSLISFGLASFGLAMLVVFLVLSKKARFIPYMSILSVYFFVFSFCLGAGGIPWFLVSEMFPQNAKPFAQAVVVGVHWTVKFFVALGFSPLVGVMGHYVFLIFLTCDVLTIVFIIFYVPETKNKTLDEVQGLLVNKKD